MTEYPCCTDTLGMPVPCQHPPERHVHRWVNEFGPDGAATDVTGQHCALCSATPEPSAEANAALPDWRDATPEQWDAARDALTDAAHFDAMLIERYPLQRDNYVAYIVAKASSEPSAEADAARQAFLTAAMEVLATADEMPEDEPESLREPLRHLRLAFNGSPIALAALSRPTPEPSAEADHTALPDDKGVCTVCGWHHPEASAEADAALRTASEKLRAVNRQYADGKVTLDADAYDDWWEAYTFDMNERPATPPLDVELLREAAQGVTSSVWSHHEDFVYVGYHEWALLRDLAALAIPDPETA